MSETVQSKALAAKTASPTAEGMSLEKTTPRVGEAPSKNNDQQPVQEGTAFGIKGLGFSKKTSGY